MPKGGHDWHRCGTHYRKQNMGTCKPFCGQWRSPWVIWTGSPEATRHIAQEVRQKDSYSLIMAKALTDAFEAWAEARLGQKSIPWAIHHIRRNLNMLRRVWRFWASSIYLVLLDISVRSGHKHTHGVQFAARRLVRQHNIDVHKPEIKRLATMQEKKRCDNPLSKSKKAWRANQSDV